MQTKSISFSKILNRTNVLVVIMNEYCQIEFVSKAAEKILGYSIHELMGDGWWNKTRSIEEGMSIKTKLQKLLHTEGASETYEHELLTQEGIVKWIRWEITNLDGHLVGIGQDITERKNYELDLKKHYLLLQEQNKNITDSIVYSSRLQQFVIQSPEVLKNFFDDAFVLYLPKDIISGDYYCFYETVDNYIVCVADCTGHGVPGAMMSFLAHSILRDVILTKHISEPAEILYKTDEAIFQLLNANKSEYCMDGMDLGVVCIDKNKQRLKFAGAQRPLVLVRENTEIEVYAPSKFPIGFMGLDQKLFFTSEVLINKGDSIYLFSDGYADQFGGPKNRKLNRKTFYEILNDMQGMKMEEQSSFLEYTLNNWKQQYEQTDDVLVLGIKI